MELQSGLEQIFQNSTMCWKFFFFVVVVVFVFLFFVVAFLLLFSFFATYQMVSNSY